MSPARKSIDEKNVWEWALASVYDFESLSSIARRYGVSRALVRDRLERFWESHDGHELLKQRAIEMGVEEELEPCNCDRCEALAESVGRRRNGHGDVIGAV